MVKCEIGTSGKSNNQQNGRWWITCFLILCLNNSFGQIDNFERALISSGGSTTPGNEIQVSTTITQIYFGSTSDPLNGLTITWRGYGTTDSIRWGYTETFENGCFSGQKRNSYTGYLYDYQFPPLKADSTIYYKIYDSLTLGWTEGKSYKCSSDTSTSNFSFLVMGDSQSHLNEWKRVSNAASFHQTDFTLFSGDIVEDGNVNSNWNNWLINAAVFLEKNLVYHAIGNHDCIGNGNNTYQDIFTLPKNPSGNEYYYSFTYGNALFICMNSEESATGTDQNVQYNWLLDVLQKNKDKTWKFIWYHRPFCSAGPHSGELYYKMDTWFKAFDDYGVDMMFSGHEHMYERSKPVQKNRTVVDQYGSAPNQGRCQIVSGGAGASLHYCSILPWIATARSTLNYCKIDVNENELNLSVYDTDNVCFDSLTINKSGMVSAKNNILEEEITVYPNPSYEQITIQGKDIGSAGLKISNIEGQKISLTGRITERNRNYWIINLKGLPSGWYLIKTREGIKKIYKY